VSERRLPRVRSQKYWAELDKKEALNAIGVASREQKSNLKPLSIIHLFKKMSSLVRMSEPKYLQGTVTKTFVW
jgi:hypothetical protein